ncbi:Protein of unknown function [Cyclobacterium lianum]|uniref:DUF4199 domain-containing protein n=1 Tax=Cyclobacterium lianum TaxID=388280 RepID=A0A1M7P956_9BACT|nr:DUF4199 domain-containing protein [Cyclobacterium lianum]SHN13288.1 Protein of unknown function [Cyclobacterium lianum]
MEPQTLKSNTPARAALNAGVIIGLLMLVFNFIVYFIDYSYLVAAWYGIVVLVLFFGLVIYFGIQYRKEIGGYMDFGAAFQFSFVTLIVSGLISTIGNMILYFVIDPGLPEMLVETQLENMVAMLDNFGAGDSISGDQIDEMRNEMANSFTVAGQLKAFGVSIIIYAILALILGAILKKKDKTKDF